MDILYEEIETSNIKYLSFIGDKSFHRFDLAIIITARFYGKILVIDLQSNKNAIIGKDDLEEEGYLEHAFNLSDVAATDLTEYLIQYVA